MVHEPSWCRHNRQGFILDYLAVTSVVKVFAGREELLKPEGQSAGGGITARGRNEVVGVSGKCT